MPAWYIVKPTDKQKRQYQKVLVKHILDKNLRNKIPKANIEVVKALFPLMKEENATWAKITP